jgi:hypothetical protein
MQAIIPKSSAACGKENSTRASSNDQAVNANRLLEHLHNGTWKHQKLLALQTKPPKFHEGEIVSSHTANFFFVILDTTDTFLS